MHFTSVECIARFLSSQFIWLSVCRLKWIIEYTYWKIDRERWKNMRATRRSLWRKDQSQTIPIHLNDSNHQQVLHTLMLYFKYTISIYRDTRTTRCVMFMKPNNIGIMTRQGGMVSDGNFQMFLFTLRYYFFFFFILSFHRSFSI